MHIGRTVRYENRIKNEEGPTEYFWRRRLAPDDRRIIELPVGSELTQIWFSDKVNGSVVRSIRENLKV